MAGRDGTGEKFAPGSRKQDRTLDDALRTMERMAAWLDSAHQENVWQHGEDPLQLAMLHGMLAHLRTSMDELLALGGDDAGELARALRTLAAQQA
jgi:hypothetical protein